jgi:hypothetical protein
MTLLINWRRVIPPGLIFSTVKVSIATPFILPREFQVVERDSRTGRRGNSNTGHQPCHASSFLGDMMLSCGKLMSLFPYRLIISNISDIASVENGISVLGTVERLDSLSPFPVPRRGIDNHAVNCSP